MTSSAVQSSYSYPTSIDQTVPAKWNHLYFSICISNISYDKYEKLFINAIEQWKSAWPHFDYMVRKNQVGCDINVQITKDSVGVTKERHSQGTTKVTYWKNSHIASADITIPTQIRKEVKQGEYCCIPLIYEISEKRFYLTSLHEFGHALGLGHAKDDGEEPFDVMQLMGEHPKHVISAVSIKALDRIYGTSTQASDHLLAIKPSVEIEVGMDKDHYTFDDTVRVYGNVSKSGGTGTIMLLKLLDGYPSMSLHRSINFVPNDGSFAVDIDLNTDLSGKWVMLMQYLGVTQTRLFEVEEVPYKASGQTDKASYLIGDVVKISGNATRYHNTISIDLVNPDGITLASKIVPVSSDKKFNADFVLRESRFAVEGQWTVSLSYADTLNDFTFNVRKA